MSLIKAYNFIVEFDKNEGRLPSPYEFMSEFYDMKYYDDKVLCELYFDHGDSECHSYELVTNAELATLKDKIKKISYEATWGRQSFTCVSRFDDAVITIITNINTILAKYNAEKDMGILRAVLNKWDGFDTDFSDCNYP